mmetsp:Transcript_5832/g.14403  ORF Transcript_5832/g.14403 Transcript_5832/m.14403 type:complete len:277 (+) Transcript_5832:545-1375(+)
MQRVSQLSSTQGSRGGRYCCSARAPTCFGWALVASELVASMDLGSSHGAVEGLHLSAARLPPPPPPLLVEGFERFRSDCRWPRCSCRRLVARTTESRHPARSCWRALLGGPRRTAARQPPRSRSRRQTSRAARRQRPYGRPWRGAAAAAEPCMTAAAAAAPAARPPEAAESRQHSAESKAASRPASPPQTQTHQASWAPACGRRPLPAKMLGRTGLTARAIALDEAEQAKVASGPAPMPMCQATSSMRRAVAKPTTGEAASGTRPPSASEAACVSH